MRDLRRLDFATNPNEELVVQVRRHVVLFTIDPLRAIITSQKLRLIVPPGGDTELTILEQYMHDWFTDRKNKMKQSINLYEMERHTLPKPIEVPENDEPQSSRMVNIMSSLHFHRQQQKRHRNNNHNHNHIIEGTSVMMDLNSDFHTQNNQIPITDLTPTNMEPNMDPNNGNTTTNDNNDNGHNNNNNPENFMLSHNKTHNLLHQNAQKDLLSGINTFEIHAFESLLATVLDVMSGQYDSLNRKAVNIVAYISTGASVTPRVQENLNFIKDQSSKMESRLKLYRQNLDNIIDNDETMALMNLTYLYKNPSLYRYPLMSEIMKRHEDVEESLEVYLTDLCSFECKLELLQGQMNSADTQASLRLDISRNKTLSANITITLITVNVTFAGYIAGVFGMNLDNVDTIQPVEGVFAIVFVGTFCLIIICSTIIYYLFRKWGIIQTIDKKKEDKYLN